LESLFITGTDTDVGKTYVTAGLAASFRKMSIDVGVMKPFAAGTAQKNGFKSSDVQILANAAKVHDSEALLNPQFFPIAASPYTVLQNLKIKPDIGLVLDNFKKLSQMHSLMLVEGIGGIMTPIIQDYFLANLIQDMGLSAIIVTRTKIGTINHTIMTCEMCKKYKIPVKGIIINNFDANGYPAHELKRDLESLSGIAVLGTIPFMDNIDDESLYDTFKNNIDLKSLVG
jgi:dethiobiotin synthetase